MADSVTRLYNAALACRHDDPSTSRTARLLRSGRSKMRITSTALGYLALFSRKRDWRAIATGRPGGGPQM